MLKIKTDYFLQCLKDASRDLPTVQSYSAVKSFRHLCFDLDFIYQLILLTKLNQHLVWSSFEFKAAFALGTLSFFLGTHIVFQVALQVGFLKQSLSQFFSVHVIPDRLDDDKIRSLCGALAVVRLLCVCVCVCVYI